MGVARIFQRGGHTDSYIGYSPNCHLNIVGCLLTKRLTKGGSRAPQDPPWLRPCQSLVNFNVRSTFYWFLFLLSCHLLVYFNDPLFIVILYRLLSSTGCLNCSCKHSLKKSGRAWRNIGKYVTFNPNRTVRLSKTKTLRTYEINTSLTEVFMYSYYRDNLPVFSYKSWFVTNIRSYNTRSASRIHISLKRTNYEKFSLGYKGATIWNILPVEIRNMNYFNQFKRRH